MLATLSALGVSDELRFKVQEAIQQLEQLEAKTQADPAVATADKPPAQQTQPLTSAKIPKKANTYNAKTQTAEAKLQMSRSIMRKLHYKNVALEKELQVCCCVWVWVCRRVCVCLRRITVACVTHTARPLSGLLTGVQGECQPHLLHSILHASHGAAQCRTRRKECARPPVSGTRPACECVLCSL